MKKSPLLSIFLIVLVDILGLTIILPLLPQVVTRVGGTLILSGILAARADEVVAACAVQGLQPAQQRENGEWWAGAFTLSRP